MTANTSTHSCFLVQSSPILAVLTMCGLLSISTTAAAPMPSTQQSANAVELTALRQLIYGMAMVRVTIGPNFVQGDITPQYTLAETVTCYAYDFYTHVSTMEADLCSCDPDYDKVVAVKYTTEQVVKDACYWMMHDGNTSNPAITTCSLKDVGNLCLHHKFQQNVDNTLLLKSHGGTLGVPGLFSSEGQLQHWLAATTRPHFGEPSQPVFEALLQMSRSTYGHNGFCSLTAPNTCYK